jgi:NAD(P)-dependent dehydrogenase (short-subunit alcohol dehydrogenase family)
MRDFDGKIVLVTGASTGLGAALAVGAAMRGARAVIINYAKSDVEAEATAAAVRAAGAEAVLAQGDVSDDGACRAIAVCGRLPVGKGFLRSSAMFGRCGRVFDLLMRHTNAAGHNAFREDGSRPKRRARSASAIVGFPIFRFRPVVALLHVRPSQFRRPQLPRLA